MFCTTTVILLLSSEVENFLTDNECDVIIGLAQHHGLQASTTVRKIKNRVSREKVMDLFYKNDLDGDGTLEKYEVQSNNLN
jgi:pantothenate kinase